ncbi:MAG: single-stranded DNA-binding protein [Bacteroidales bacterium]|jgi:single-strand DNA-binding protein
MKSYNRIVILGRLKQKFPPKILSDNNIIMPVIVNTDYTYKNKAGKTQRFEEDNYVVFWNQLAKNFDDFVKIGDIVFLEGRLQSRFWYEGETLRHETNSLAERFFSIPNDNKESKIYGD